MRLETDQSIKMRGSKAGTTKRKSVSEAEVISPDPIEETEEPAQKRTNTRTR